MAALETRLKYQASNADNSPSRRVASPSWLLVAGLLVVSLAGAIKSGMSNATQATGTPMAVEYEPAVPEISPSKANLNVVMAAALDSVALRYRVAPEALQPIFVAAQTAAKDLDPLLIIAIIGIESGFNPLAQSVMGAQGLMQVIPRYHRDKLPRDVANTSFLDPVSNVRVGAQVLHEAIRRQGGLVEGLQYYAGAVDDPDRGYAARVIAEKQRLEQAVRTRKSMSYGTATLGRSTLVPAKEAPQN